MIDSSGRRGLRANGTVLDLIPVGQVMGVVGALLVALFTLVKPEASNGLWLGARVLFWALHVGLGLGALWVAGRWLASGKRLPSGTLASVVITGCAGALLATPGYLALDALFAPYIVDLDPDPSSDGPLVQMARESLELTPWFLSAWLLINLPVLLPSPNTPLPLDDSVGHNPKNDHSSDTTDQTDAGGLNSKASLHLVSTTTPASVDLIERKEVQAKQRFLLNLPGIVGTDLIAVSSDLHYLNVWTVSGRTTILGNLRDVVAELGDVGMQVHRSHWVAHAHVRRIVGSATDAACILSNELRVPISRRRWKDVRNQYGRGVVHSSGLADENQA
ncbi:MAG: LytTR family transcriptional regulator [Gammaproteobacteria bacterium]|nr:LytTR family transcriptional regulator [Gammaproteobacteria bacterium]